MGNHVIFVYLIYFLFARIDAMKDYTFILKISKIRSHGLLRWWRHASDNYKTRKTFADKFPVKFSRHQVDWTGGSKKIKFYDFRTLTGALMNVIWKWEIRWHNLSKINSLISATIIFVIFWDSFDVLPNFAFTTSETMRDYYLQTWYVKVASHAAQRPKT